MLGPAGMRVPAGYGQTFTKFVADNAPKGS